MFHIGRWWFRPLNFETKGFGSKQIPLVNFFCLSLFSFVLFVYFFQSCLSSFLISKCSTPAFEYVFRGSLSSMTRTHHELSCSYPSIWIRILRSTGINWPRRAKFYQSFEPSFCTPSASSSCINSTQVWLKWLVKVHINSKTDWINISILIFHLSKVNIGCLGAYEYARVPNVTPSRSHL